MKLIIPSFDRACQLELLLFSLRKNIKDYNNIYSTVLYRASSASFAEGYQQVIKEYPEVTFILEENFDRQIKDQLAFCGFVGFLTDDCIFYREYRPTIKDTLDLIWDDTLCFSWRLGLNTTTQYYVTWEQQPSLEQLGYGCFGDYSKDEYFIKWNWKVRPPQTNYGYPFSWDGHIYFGNELYTICKDWDFHNPRSFESQMVAPSVKDKFKKNMVAGSLGHIFVNTINCCQQEKIPAGLRHRYSLEELNNKFLDGYRIDLNGFDFDDCVTSACHGELPLVWRKK